MVDALVVAQTVKGTVDTLADVAHRLLRGSHVHVLNVALQPGQRGEILVAGIATEVFAPDSTSAGSGSVVIVVVIAETTGGRGCRSHRLQTAQG